MDMGMYKVSSNTTSPLPAAYHAPLPPQSGGIIGCRWEDIEGREWRNEWEIRWGWAGIR